MEVMSVPGAGRKEVGSCQIYRARSKQGLNIDTRKPLALPLQLETLEMSALRLAFSTRAVFLYRLSVKRRLHLPLQDSPSNLFSCRNCSAKRLSFTSTSPKPLRVLTTKPRCAHCCHQAKWFPVFETGFRWCQNMNLDVEKSFFCFFLLFCAFGATFVYLCICTFVCSYNCCFSFLLLRGRLVELPLFGRIKYYQSIELNMALSEEERRRETGT